MKDIIIRLTVTIGIAGILLGYNQKTGANVAADEKERTRVAAENDRIAEWNSKIIEESGIEREQIFVPGEYTDESQGFGGMIEVKVLVDEYSIKEIEILSAPNEDSAYLSMAATIIDEIIQAQSPSIDAVSGATFSSTGIKNAVVKALQKAKK